VIKRTPHRRTVLIAAGAAALAAAAGSAVAQTADIRGAVTFKGGKAIPQGDLQIYLEDLAINDSAHRRVAETRVISDGASTTITFAIQHPATATPTLQIVARLMRADGWLVARASAPVNATTPVDLTLKEAVY
jgi:uncharacterized lipoprotein YbaY